MAATCGPGPRRSAPSTTLSVHGELSARALLLDQYTWAGAGGGVRGLVYAGDRWEGFRPDIVNDGEGGDGCFFHPALLDRYGCLDFRKAVPAALAGERLFLPGVEETFPARLLLRRTE